MNENEYATRITECLLGGWKPEEVKAYSEVPRFSNNNHMDLLMIYPKKEEMIAIEFKTNSPKDLFMQVYRNSSTVGIDTVGICPKEVSQENKLTRHKFIKLSKELPDGELCNAVSEIGNMYWTSIFRPGMAMMYWYSYKNKPSDFSNVGKKNCTRESFFQVYRRAIKNLHRELGDRISFTIAYGLFRGYSKSTAKQHYRKALSEIGGED